MARVSVLYIRDPVVGPHLELLRNICEPASKAIPHVTVRFFERLKIPPDHLSSSVSHIDLLEPASFGLESDSTQSNRTVFIRCHSDDLLALEHKPYFPTSEFHITIYDGTSSLFASSLLKLLGRYRWGFRLNFESPQSLSELQIKPKRRRSKNIQAAGSPMERNYRPDVSNLYYNIFGKAMSYSVLMALDDRQRLSAARKICDHLARCTANFKRVSPAQRILFEEPNDGSFQNEPEVHLTPPELARSIAAYAVSLMPEGQAIDFGDPAVGTGAFFAAVLAVHGSRPIESAIGVDISAKQAEAANWRWREKGLDVHHGDYLHMERMHARNLVLANPPYLRHQDIDTAYKLELRQRASVILGHPISGLAGQYVYFMVLSHAWMQRDAVAAWLIPSEFMRSGYGDALRNYLTHQVTLIRIHQYDESDPQFENARVLPAVVVFKNSPPDPSHMCLLSADGTLEHPAVQSMVRVDSMRNLRMWSIPWAPPVELSPGDVRLGDLFDVKRGIATGANSFFIIKRSEAGRLGIPAACVKPILPRTRNLPSSIIKSLPNGYPEVAEQLCVIDTSLPEDEIERSYPAFFEYLQQAKEANILSRNLVKSRKPWYRQEQREPAPFVCTYMGRGTASRSAIRFYWNQSDAIATNAYLMLYPKVHLAQKLSKFPHLYASIHAALQAAACSTVEAESRHHADGLEKIEPGDLRQVVLKGLPKSVISLAPRILV